MQTKSALRIFSMDVLQDSQIIVYEFLTSVAKRVEGDWQLEQVSVRR